MSLGRLGQYLAVTRHGQGWRVQIMAEGADVVLKDRYVPNLSRNRDAAIAELVVIVSGMLKRHHERTSSLDGLWHGTFPPSAGGRT